MKITETHVRDILFLGKLGLYSSDIIHLNRLCKKWVSAKKRYGVSHHTDTAEHYIMSKLVALPCYVEFMDIGIIKIHFTEEKDIHVVMPLGE